MSFSSVQKDCPGKGKALFHNADGAQRVGLGGSRSVVDGGLLPDACEILEDGISGHYAGELLCELLQATLILFRILLLIVEEPKPGRSSRSRFPEEVYNRGIFLGPSVTGGFAQVGVDDF